MRALALMAFLLGWGEKPPTGLPAPGTAPLFFFASPNTYAGYPVPYQGLPNKGAPGCYAASAVTGGKGEALTFTRATTRFCPTDPSGNEENGKTCASGEVCITQSGATVGMSVWRAGTNIAIRSEEFESAGWGNLTTTVTANYGTAPDGTQTADRVQGAACGAGIVGLFQTGTPAHQTFSLWVRGTSGAGSMRIYIYDGVSGSSTLVKYTTTWKRVSVYDADLNIEHGLGCVGVASVGGSDTGAFDVLVWGAQGEANPYASPYIATAGASATRNEETAYFTVALGTPTTFSMAATLAAVAAPTTKVNAGAVAAHSGFPSGGPEFLAYWTGGSVFGMYLNPNDRAQVLPTTANPARAYAYCSDTTTENGIGYGANTATNANGCGTLANTTAIAIGWYAANTQIDGIVGDVCADTDASRCR